MSSTNRSEARKEHIADYYVTPINEIELFLGKFLQEITIDKNIKILDPCAGGDEENLMSYPIALIKSGFNYIDTIDIRDDSRAKLKANYLETACKNKYDIIITNPPFNISIDIIEKALHDVRENGYVIMLLRLNYFGSQKRKYLWEKHMPIYTFVHHQRLGFIPMNSKTDSIEYAHFVWHKEDCPDFTKLKVI